MEENSIKRYISSPTEDSYEQEQEEEIIELDQDLSWPSFIDIKGILDFKSDSLPDEYLVSLFTYIIKGTISSINVANINYILKLFYENETKIYSAYKDKRSISDPKVKKLLENRKFMYLELLKELNLK